MNLTWTLAVAMVLACTTRIDLNGQDRSSPEELIHYVIVRADLPFGSQVAQSVHAAGESASPKPVPGTIAVALHARDEGHLRELSAAIAAADLRYHCVFESVDDAKYPGQMMAIGLHPIPVAQRDRIRRVLSALPLVK